MGHDERLHGVLLAAGARLITLGEIGARPRRTAGPSTLAYRNTRNQAAKAFRTVGVSLPRRHWSAARLIASAWVG